MNPVSNSTVPGLTQTSTFHFWNGDEYTGEYATLKDKQKVVMEGKGIYKTSDGETYEGIWENDQLNGECKIIFSDKSEFSGVLNKMQIQGPGRCRFKEGVEISGEFVENKLTGKVYLTDPNGHTWKSEVKEDEKIYFYPLHSFWQSVLNMPLKHQVFYDGGEENEESDRTSEEF